MGVEGEMMVSIRNLRVKVGRHCVKRNINPRIERSTFKYKEEEGGRGAERGDSQASVLI